MMKCSIGLFLFLIITVHLETVWGFTLFGIRLWGEDATEESSVGAVTFKEDFLRVNEKFALQLMQVLEKEANNSKNVFISSFSIGLAMTMAMVGANGDTYTQIHRTLGFSPSLSRNQITTGYQQLLSQLNDSIAVANAIAVRPGISILPDYLTKLQNNFSSELFNTIEPDKIDKWCSNKTRGMIKEIAPKDTSQVAVVLLNAIFFKSDWETPFSRVEYKEKFYIAPKEVKSINFMEITEYFAYGKFDDGELLQLPYKNNSLSMFVFLPRYHLNSEISAVLKHSLFNRISQMHSTNVYLKMPSFKLESSHELRKHLVALGVEDAFKNTSADFSRISDQTKLYLSSVKHKAAIEVDEVGTKAAAATAVEIFYVSVPQEPIPVIINRPFMFFIRKRNNGVILFSGVVRNP